MWKSSKSLKSWHSSRCFNPDTSLQSKTFSKMELFRIPNPNFFSHDMIPLEQNTHVSNWDNIKKI